VEKLFISAKLSSLQISQSIYSKLISLQDWLLAGGQRGQFWPSLWNIRSSSPGPDDIQLFTSV